MCCRNCQLYSRDYTLSMKRYTPYYHIRSSAVIMGLKTPYFVMLVGAIIMGAFVLIFSFNIGKLLLILPLWLGVYVGLTRISRKGITIVLQTIFPRAISNRQTQPFTYDD